MMTRTTLRPVLIAVLTGLGLTMFSTRYARAEATDLHFDLAKSVPAADSTVAPPQTVQLWFTEVPQEGSVSIRVIGADGEPIHASEVAQASEEPTSFSVDLHHTLASGSYTVAWRGMGSDGHVVRDDFAFAVAAQR